MYGKLSERRAIGQRDAESRSDPRAGLADPRGRYLLIQEGDVPFDGALVFLTRGQFQQLGAPEPSYLGVFDGRPYFGVDAGALSVDRAWQGELAGLRFAPLREVGHLLNEAEAALAMEAMALLNWHGTPYCPMCGQRAELVESGWQMRCPGGHVIFPRMDPAVIMAIRDGADRLLLGRNRSWPAGRFSTLAGFVEAGETLEDAVRREVLEEAGIEVGRLEYFASQPWPYPRSLMVGFRGWTAQEAPELRPDGVEVVEAMFVTRAELRQMYADNPASMPGPTSVARALIEDWLGGPLERGGARV
ncbi:NAD(+) diphosphatase [Trueperella bernardiae]|uniref:NAD(+) diphosphatase n=1 Tax=Trueperella bernardiae TaxID=59561 RepID=A0AAW6ZL58_9ACTO|nr:NAD(+) diphosphatase [Trueperella bernardiae]MDK8602196.1 NAD(+) diphosphatase [Trueperella bernardiae]